MKIVVTESQYLRIISEQPDSKMPFQIEKLGYNPYSKDPSQSMNAAVKRQSEAIKNVNPHTVMALLAIGTAFIPVAGPFISAGIGLADAKMYFDEGEKGTAGLTVLFSMLPFIGPVVSKIPGVKQLGSKGMALLAKKISRGGKYLTMAEAEIANAVKSNSIEIQKELAKMAPKLKGVMKEINLYKSNFIKKYGIDEYDDLLKKYLWDRIDKKTLISNLKNIKAPNIKIKPILGGGADHNIFQSAIHPDKLFKAEIRPGEIDKWYNLFKGNPKIFPQTFNKVKVKGVDGKVLTAVVIEKLNTSPFMNLWDGLEKTLHKFHSSLPHSEQVSTFEYFVKHIKEPKYAKQWGNFIQFAKKQNQSLSGKIDEFVKMVDELYKTTPNPDIRKFNLGYDKNGVLKALDI
jgi:hypothetical protein